MTVVGVVVIGYSASNNLVIVVVEVFRCYGTWLVIVVLKLCSM